MTPDRPDPDLPATAALSQDELPSSDAHEAPQDDAAQPIARLLDALRQITGLQDLSVDDDGDVGVRFGRVGCFVRIDGAPAVVRLHTVLLTGVERSAALMDRLNALNAAIGGPRVFLADDLVFASAELPAEPLVAAHLGQALARFCIGCDGLGDALRRRFGGTLPWEAPTPATLH